jgi:hypothetical protein
MKEEEELNRAFGSGPKFNVPKPAAKGEGEQKMTKIMIFGNSNQCEVAQRMIDEAIENKVMACPHTGLHSSLTAAQGLRERVPRREWQHFLAP